MGQSRRRRPPRQWILGILLLSVSILTALSLPGPRWGSMTGPFGRIWVLLWARAFGVPGLWLILAVGTLWGVALLLRWQRGFLWALSVLIWPLIVAWDAFASVVTAGRGDPAQGEIALYLQEAVIAFFGPGATVQHALALGALALTLTVITLRWGLPDPARRLLAAAACAVGRWLALICRALGLALWWVLSFTGRQVAGLALRVLAPAGQRLIQGVGRLPRRAGRSTPPAVASSPAPAAQASASLPAPSPAPLIATGVSHPVGLDSAATAAPETPAGAQPRAAAPRAPRSPSAGRSADAPELPPDAQPRAPYELLNDPRADQTAVSDEEIRANAALLKETLASFGITGEVSEVHPGPVITRYEFTPGVGVTISQIVSRQDDLALAMRAPRVRLLAPIPGKAAVGVEIPNREPALIRFCDVVATDAFREARDSLVMALGKDVAGRPFFAALDKMPHLLVAGTTGSGKSVCLNTLIVSLLLHNTPENLRLVMIDPKMLEFTLFNDIPHLARPVLTEDRDAARALRWLTREMERRYRTLAGVGVRNIQGYHAKRDAEPEEPLPPMPYIVVFVDELADLMLSNSSEIEVPIARLAQMARAVGIHLVLATQRPSVDVITGVIKANFPARIAFQVASRTDSRTVLDMNGAESLLGRGDMLFIPPGKAQAHRIHGAYLGDDEIERITSYLRQFPPAEPLQAPDQGEESAGGEDDLEDPLFNEALRIVVSGQQGSTSLLQRRLRVGYTRAGRLMDMLERAGIVGPPDGSRARDVLVPPQYLEEDLVGSGKD